MFKNTYHKPYDPKAYFAGYHQDATYFDLSQDRIALISKEIQERRVKTILDIGYFPGLIGRLIKEEYPEVHLHGIGKCNETTTEKFPWYNDITDADFDPFYGNQKIPRLEKKFDLIIGIEIIEHLINPLPFFQFIADHVGEQGVALITTPNVSSFDAIGRLLKGKSNYEALENSVIFIRNDWRAHARLYDKRELEVLGKHVGLMVKKHGFYFNKALFYERRKGLNWLFRVLFSLIPHYREDQFTIYQKVQ